MSTPRPADASVFLVVAGTAPPDALKAANANPPVLTNGLTFRFPSLQGAVDLTIAAPNNLAAFADLAAAAILKPVCIPIALTNAHHGVVQANLSDSPTAHKLAQQLLAAMTAANPPARPCRCLHDCTSSLPHNSRKES